MGQDITVLGAGIGGLATALAAAQRGAAVELIERAPEIAEVGAGVQISPNGWAVLKALGLQAPLLKVGDRTQEVGLYAHRQGQRIARLDVSRAPYVLLHRADLIGVLHEAATKAGVNLRLEAEVSGLTCTSDGVALQFADGTEQERKTVWAADGVHSVARKACQPDIEPEFSGQVAWRALVPATEGAAPAAKVFMGPGRHLVCYPLRQGKWMNIIGVQERAEWARDGWMVPDDPANLRAAFAGFCADVQDLLGRVETCYLWGLFDHPVLDTWHRGGLTLLGDAAHPMLPFMAQGANMALEDAWLLAAAFDGGAGPVAYEQARKARVRRVAAAAKANGRNYHLSDPIKTTVAHSGLRLISRFAPAMLLRRFDWLYGYDAKKEKL